MWIGCLIPWITHFITRFIEKIFECLKWDKKIGITTPLCPKQVEVVCPFSRWEEQWFTYPIHLQTWKAKLHNKMNMTKWALQYHPVTHGTYKWIIMLEKCVRGSGIWLSKNRQNINFQFWKKELAKIIAEHVYFLKLVSTRPYL